MMYTPAAPRFVHDGVHIHPINAIAFGPAFAAVRGPSLKKTPKISKRFPRADPVLLDFLKDQPKEMV
jgi:hypothetical protein